MHIATALLVFLAQDPDDEQIKRWIRQLGADYLEEREEAKKKLSALGKKAEDPLIAALSNTDYRVRRACLELLVGMQSTKAVKPVAEIFRNAQEDRTVRQAAFDYLRGAKKEAEDVLIEALSSDDRAFRLGAVQALRDMKSEKCAEKVAELYDREQEKDIKDAAFDCLKNIGKPAQPYLLKLLGSNDASVRNGAVEGLRNINKDSKDPAVIEKIGELFVAESDTTVLNNAHAFLSDCGEKATKYFVAGLRSVQEGVRLRSLEGLAKLKSDAGIPGASELLERDVSDSVREKAKDYLQEFGLRAEPAFIRALESENPKVKLLAIEGLGVIKSSKPLSRISKMFREDKDPNVHRKAFAYLANLGLPAEDDLIFAIDDADPKIKLEAVAALGAARSEKAVSHLLALLNDLKAELKSAAIDALVRIGPKAIEKVEEGRAAGKISKRDADRIVGLFYRVEVERILADLLSDAGGVGFYEGMFGAVRTFGIAKALPVLISIARDRQYQPKFIVAKGEADRYGRSLRELAILALGELGEASAVEPLEEALRETPVGPEDEYANLIVALYKLGAKKHLEKFADTMEREAAAHLATEGGREEGYKRIFAVAIVHSRVALREKAEKDYLRAVQLIEKHGISPESDLYYSALYNIACLRALRGDKKGAVEFLRRAVVAGFKDRSWIRQDRDLENLRGEDDFKRLIADEELFKEKKE